MKRKRTSKPKPVRAKKSAQQAAPNGTTVSVKPVDAIDSLVTAGAEALGLDLDPAWHAGIKFNLQLILSHAALVEEFPLPDDAEPAPVFYA
jgi:Protein of unknown function (DUF4089)